MKENDQFTLYELSKMYQNVLSLIEDGADPEEFESVLDTINLSKKKRKATKL